MTYIKGSIQTYLKDLAAKSPAPGGGSSAALAAAMAASLVGMACRFTLGKPGYKKVERRVTDILKESLSQLARLEILLDEDVLAYRSRDLASAIEVPAEVCLLSYGIAGEAHTLLKIGNKRLATDTALAITLASSSFIAALSYVAVNIRWWPAAPDSCVTRYKDLKRLLKDVYRMRQDAEVSLGYSSGR